MQVSGSTHVAVVIGQPVHFTQGEFTGQTIRAVLSEIQQPEIGRKYARKDRRPLDPPPVVELKLFRVYHLGTDRQVEVEMENYSNIQSSGRLCHVDLFPVPDPSATQHQAVASSSTTLIDHTDLGLGMSYQNSSEFATPSGSNIPNPIVDGSVFLYPIGPRPAHHIAPPFPNHEPDVVVQSISESSHRENLKCTEALSGTTFTEAVCIEYEGKERLMLIFPDLAVKMIGTFILRYRYFDIFARSESSGPHDLPILAECLGGPFRVFSTKEFPGLGPSTALTKHITRWGVRANLRDSERKRRRPGEIPNSTIDPPVASDLSPSVDVAPVFEPPSEWIPYE
ncbi:hypothetical protein JAAARDRAFT_128280 [Jaapia argillacea MUCL 33604]|uniref:Velvet domain-containing protein n=1 Tax=Jaapia argillacea MUCL 33604 TaxID=933084 RepID=A0A067Q7Z9_9AGAM|nr:hypothetical protein JAAARDRAFT_128280 [Jaapia argillacea MUCL 33604]